MLEFLKNYYVFMLVLLVVSYLVPKEEYKVYIQFFIGIFVIVLMLRPVLELFTADPEKVYDVFESFNTQIKEFDVEFEGGENIFEHFYLEGEGE